MSDDADKPVPPDPNWNDPPMRACSAWIRAYRSPSRKPRPPRPSLRFASHLGQCARDLWEAETPEAEMVRRFSLAGSTDRCVCGRRPVDGEFGAAE